MLSMLDKMANWIENFKGWIYNKKPRHKYLRIAYYSLSGLIFSVFIILITLMMAAVISGLLGTLFWFIVYLINVEDYAHLALKLLAGFLILLAVSIIGYFEFGDN